MKKIMTKETMKKAKGAQLKLVTRRLARMKVNQLTATDWSYLETATTLGKKGD